MDFEWTGLLRTGAQFEGRKGRTLVDTEERCGYLGHMGLLISFKEERALVLKGDYIHSCNQAFGFSTKMFIPDFGIRSFLKDTFSFSSQS